MAAAVAHTHFIAHTSHMDLKPGNFLLDADFDLVLIDWEQSDTPVTTAAPEIGGTWDVEEIPAGDSVSIALWLLLHYSLCVLSLLDPKIDTRMKTDRLQSQRRSNINNLPGTRIQYQMDL
jgi:hypothetical protein